MPTKPAVAAAETRPRITLSAEDHERLSALAQAAGHKASALAADLAAELERAHVLARGRVPEHAVRMDSEVTFRDEAASRSRTVTLVYPGEADIAQGRISILTPVGTALVGVRVGDTIAWTVPSGETRRFTVLAVRERQPA
ncbi:nucleoside diphosphate kinase regulator [Labrys wisconsinensis]|uniref:Regulator of nucleoside diphosphate kinase n=1 Tax=Labrys wisconsinensis TaxID=425677 RepID=A0ABU0J9P0_9HYPH|nr:nucleoside diphosphate kinase regulator [Labrys wisconsinensis]MDQ0470992.1 regulator of nucleoside diphosphate kinase [Labrys wisconsinensis]